MFNWIKISNKLLVDKNIMFAIKLYALMSKTKKNKPIKINNNDEYCFMLIHWKINNAIDIFIIN